MTVKSESLESMLAFYKKEYEDYQWRVDNWRCSHSKQLANRAWHAMNAVKVRMQAIADGKPDPMEAHF